VSGQRGVRLVEVAPGPDGAAAVLDALPDALAGSGPALAIAPAGDDDASLRARAAVLPSPDVTVDDDVAVVVATSGSTGAPRGVLLPAAALLSGARATEEACVGPGAWTLALPVTSVAGLMVLVRSLVASTEPEIVASVGGASPFSAAAFAEATWRLDPSVPACTSLVPAQAALLLDDPDGRAALLAHELVLVGAGRTPPELLDRLRSAGAAVVTTYGMTETCGGIVYDGVPLPGADVRLLDVDDDGVGRIELGGPMIARGYLDGPSDAFVDGRHRTADLGRLVDGRLEVLGRVDDVVKIGGVSVAVAAVEDALRPLLDDVAVLVDDDAAWGARLTAYVVGAADEESLAAAVAARLGRAAVPRTWVRLGELPQLPNGKPDREALRRRG